MNAKTTLVLIALIGVGLFALPQTTALFAGQHSFTNIDATVTDRMRQMSW